MMPCTTSPRWTRCRLGARRSAPSWLVVWWPFLVAVGRSVGLLPACLAASPGVFDGGGIHQWGLPNPRKGGARESSAGRFSAELILVILVMLV
jgi:hypothetical protein